MDKNKDKETILKLFHLLCESFGTTEDKTLLNPVYGEISASLGVENAIEIYRLFAGQQITFPVHFFHHEGIRQTILEEFNGKNIRALAKKYGYSEKTIRRILKKT